MCLKIFVTGEYNDANADTWEDAHMFCPNKCVCQRSPFMDLSMAHWIQEMRRDQTHQKNMNAPYDTIFNDVTSILIVKLKICTHIHNVIGLLRE